MKLAQTADIKGEEESLFLHNYLHLIINRSSWQSFENGRNRMETDL